MNLFGKIKQVTQNPSLGVGYAKYLFSGCTTSGRPTRLMHGRVRLGGFTGFSEYHSCASAVSVEEFRLLKVLPGVDGVILDVGANLGLVSLLLADSFPDKRIFSFEPNPRTYADLCDNIRLNQAANVAPIQLALGAKQAILPFQTSENSRATAKLARAGDDNTVDIQCTTIDLFVQAQLADSKIAFIKVDTEGHEAAVFQGAQVTLASGIVSAIYYEICPPLAEQAGYSATLASEILDSHGYRLFRPTDSGSLESVTPNDARGVALENWIAVSKTRDLREINVVI